MGDMLDPEAEHRKELEVLDISPRTGLLRHTRNVFSNTIGMLLENKNNATAVSILLAAFKKRPLSDYEAIVGEFNPKEAKKIVQKSDPIKIQKFNDFVKKFNIIRERILPKAVLDEQDYQELDNLWKKVDEEVFKRN